MNSYSWLIFESKFSTLQREDCWSNPTILLTRTIPKWNFTKKQNLHVCNPALHTQVGLLTLGTPAMFLCSNWCYELAKDELLHLSIGRWKHIPNNLILLVFVTLIFLLIPMEFLVQDQLCVSSLEDSVQQISLGWSLYSHSLFRIIERYVPHRNKKPATMQVVILPPHVLLGNTLIKNICLDY